MNTKPEHPLQHHISVHKPVRATYRKHKIGGLIIVIVGATYVIRIVIPAASFVPESILGGVIGKVVEEILEHL